MHPSTTTGSSQCALILERLQAAPGEWVAMPDLVTASGSYNIHSRIADLRRAGHQIDHKNTHAGRFIHSFYRLYQPTGQLSLF